MKVNAVSINDTKYFNFKEEDKSFIKEIRSVYMYNPESSTHCAEITPSHYLEYLYTYLICDIDTPDNVQDELDERYCHENGEDIYMHCADVRKLPNIKECGEFETMEEAREYLCGNCPF